MGSDLDIQFAWLWEQGNGPRALFQGEKASKRHRPPTRPSTAIHTSIAPQRPTVCFSDVCRLNVLRRKSSGSADTFVSPS